MSIKPQRLNTVGQTYHDFEVTKAIEIPELQCFLRELVHIPTGAHVMHISNEDPENMFCLSFKTLPDSSNGVAHILEHTVLCGSEKYPVKDPFFAMSRRSLNTFMNALTGSDFTCYPAASQVPKDFYNLLEVYLDAVFKPRLSEYSFLQEGHRLEFADPADSTSSLEHKGIVYNEMKGALASPHARLMEAMTHALFPDVTYGVNSGGDPKDIPNLTYPELCAFFHQYYHPSRCLFFFYGNIPLEYHLDFISQHALQGVKKLDPLPPIPMQPRFTQPKHLTMEYPIASDEDSTDKAYISFGWLMCHILEQQEILALSIIEIILMDTDASPLKRALLDSGLCKQASVSIDTDINEVPIIITLTGCNPSDADKLENVLRTTLEQIIHDGISLEAVENAMHQLEIFRSEITGNSAPFGLSLFMRSALLKQHEANPEDGLMIHTLFEHIRRENLENPRYLPGLIRKYFLDNPHFVRIVMSPSKDLAAREIEEEKKGLEEIFNQMTALQKKALIDKAAELASFQKKQEEEDLDILPKISLEDVPVMPRQYLLKEEKLGSLQVFHHDCFTNEIVYADLVCDLPEITPVDMPLVRLLTILMPQLGCGGRSYVENLDYMQANTGGVGATLSFNRQAADASRFVPSLYLRGKALYRKANKLFPLMSEMAHRIDFTDRPRLKEVVLKHATGLLNGLNQNALRYAINLSATPLDDSSRIANVWFGIEYFQYIRNLAENYDKEEDSLIEKLKQLHKMLLRVENPHLVITCTSDMYEALKNQDFYGLQNLLTTQRRPWKCSYPQVLIPSQGRIISSPVAFTGHVFKTVSYVHPDAPALSIASCLFDNLTLHKKIREQGGAYGGGSTYSPMASSFYFYAYRDPNIFSTLNAFSESIQGVIEGRFDEADIEESKLEIIQDLDAPVAPGSRGELAYGWLREGRTPELRQTFRNALLSTNKENVISGVQNHIVAPYKTGISICFAGKELLEKENARLIAEGLSPLQIEPI